MSASIVLIAWLKTIGVRIMALVPNMIFKKFIYPDSVFKEHFELRPTCEGIYIYKGQPGRIQIPFDVINLSPYYDVFIESMKVSVGSFIDVSLQSEVISRLKVKRVVLDAILSSEQEQGMNKAGMFTINCGVKFSWGRKETLLWKGFTFQDIVINKRCLS